jgi:hypothetical protein
MKGVTEMLNQSFVLEVLANDHRNDLLNGTTTDQAARQMKGEGFGQASRLKRLVAFLSGLRIGAVRPVADRASLFTDEMITAGRR